MGALLPAGRLQSGEDLAAEHPDKLAELKEVFWQEAERNRALPLLGGFAVFFGMVPPMPTKTRFRSPPMSRTSRRR